MRRCSRQRHQLQRVERRGGAAAAAGSGKFDVALVRFPQAVEVLAPLLSAVASQLRAGALVVLYGTPGEGLRGVPDAIFATHFEDAAMRVRASTAGGALVITARRCAAALPPPENWATDAPLALPGGSSIPWRTYPGLFAGGRLDVMTAALLAALPPPPPHARVVDFACGSGVLAAALLLRDPSLRLTLVDADTLALAAAADNVPAARRIICADAWPPHALRRRRQHWIVSNPPVHRGQPDDLRVLAALLAGAPARLVPGGQLFLVAQAHVPVGALARAVAPGAYALLRATPVGDEKRFVVWRGEVV